MLPNLQQTADFVTCIGEILNGKLYLTPVSERRFDGQKKFYYSHFQFLLILISTVTNKLTLEQIFFERD